MLTMVLLRTLPLSMLCDLVCRILILEPLKKKLEGWQMLKEGTGVGVLWVLGIKPKTSARAANAPFH